MEPWCGAQEKGEPEHGRMRSSSPSGGGEDSMERVSTGFGSRQLGTPPRFSPQASSSLDAVETVGVT